MSTVARRYPVGAEVQRAGVHFRLWAPQGEHVTLVIEGRELAMTPANDGYHEMFVGETKPGSRYGFRLDGSGPVLPDPASRWQPDGPHALSAVVDPSAYRWSDGGWRGIDPRTGHHYDDTKRYVDALAISDDQRHAIFEGNARRVFPRLDARLKEKGL